LIYAVDEIRGGDESFPGFSERRRHLSESLLEIAHMSGDSSQVSGPIDYLIRLTTSKWLLRPLPASDAFVVVDNVDNLIVFEKHGESLDSIVVLDAAESWFDAICTAFEEFRSGLEGG
jgi:hypothetical protein